MTNPASRDPHEFAAVYEDHVDAVHRFFIFRLRRRELAEDLTQLTFEKALRSWARFDPAKASVRTWLLVIARNLLIDHSRRRHEDLVPVFDDADLPTVEGPEAADDPWPELLVALAGLNDREREVLGLRYAGGMSGPEIAQVTELSVANVQQILSRSLRKLRERLEPA